MLVWLKMHIASSANEQTRLTFAICCCCCCCCQWICELDLLLLLVTFYAHTSYFLRLMPRSTLWVPKVSLCQKFYNSKFNGLESKVCVGSQHELQGLLSVCTQKQISLCKLINLLCNQLIKVLIDATNCDSNSIRLPSLSTSHISCGVLWKVWGQ